LKMDRGGEERGDMKKRQGEMVMRKKGNEVGQKKGGVRRDEHKGGKGQN